MIPRVRIRRTHWTVYTRPLPPFYPVAIARYRWHWMAALRCRWINRQLTPEGWPRAWMREEYTVELLDGHLIDRPVKVPLPRARTRVRAWWER